MLRALLISRLSRSGHQPTIDAAREKFRDHVDKKVELYPDLRSVIYGIVSRNDGKDGVEKLRNIFENVGFSEIERNCIAAMGQATSEDVLKTVYDYGVTQGKIRPQDLVSLFAGSRSHRAGQDFTWQFFKDNTSLLIEKFGSVNSALFQHCLKCSASSQCDLQFADNVEKFCKDKFDADALKVLDRPIRQTVESIRLNNRLLKNSAQAVKDYLNKAGH